MIKAPVSGIYSVESRNLPKIDYVSHWPLRFGAAHAPRSLALTMSRERRRGFGLKWVYGVGWAYCYFWL